MSNGRKKQLVVIKLAEKDWARSVGVIHHRDRTLSVGARKFVQLPASGNEN
jgi:hypothetical protein